MGKRVAFTIRRSGPWSLVKAADAFSARFATSRWPVSICARRGVRRVAFGVSATRCQLWLGTDHLLAVDHTLTAEEYRRFYFRDIEAFVIRRTVARQVWNWIMGVLAVLTVVPAGWYSVPDG